MQGRRWQRGGMILARETVADARSSATRTILLLIPLVESGFQSDYAPVYIYNFLLLLSKLSAAVRNQRECKRSHGSNSN